MTAETTFAEKVLGLPTRIEDNLILYSDTWKQWDVEKPSPNSDILAINLDGERETFRCHIDGRLYLLGMGFRIESPFRPQIWRYI